MTKRLEQGRVRALLQGYTEARRAGRFARPGSEVLAELRRAIEVH